MTQNKPREESAEQVLLRMVDGFIESVRIEKSVAERLGKRVARRPGANTRKRTAARVAVDV